MKRMTILAAVATMSIALAAPAYADDVDSDFNAQLHTYGIYGPKDKMAYLAKIACDRLGTGLDPDAYKSTEFLSKNLKPTATDTQQDWQFLSASINTYCPDLQPVLQRASNH